MAILTATPTIRPSTTVAPIAFNNAPVPTQQVITKTPTIITPEARIQGEAEKQARIDALNKKMEDLQKQIDANPYTVVNAPVEKAQTITKTPTIRTAEQTSAGDAEHAQRLAAEAAQKQQKAVELAYNEQQFKPTETSNTGDTVKIPTISLAGKAYGTDTFNKVASVAPNVPQTQSFKGNYDDIKKALAEKTVLGTQGTKMSEVTPTTAADVNAPTTTSFTPKTNVPEALGNKVVLPGTREWNAMVNPNSLTPEQLAMQQKLETMSPQDMSTVSTDVEVSQPEQKSQYELLREQAQAQGVRERQATEEELKAQLASRGLGLGTGFGEKQLQKARNEALRSEAGRLGQIDVAEAQASEAKAETERQRKFQAEQAGLDRQLTRDLEQGKISMQEKELALNAAQFTSKQEFDAWATEQGFTDNERERAWNAMETSKARQLTASESALDRQLTADVEQGKITMQEKELAINASQFQSKQEFDAWATEQGFNEAERQRAWDASENAVAREFQQSERVATQQFTASENAIERELTKAIEQGKLTLQEKELAQNATQFKSKQEFDSWALQQGFQENERERAWTAAQEANRQAYDTETRLSTQNFQTELANLENDLTIGRMNIADTIDDNNKLQSQAMDAAYQRGLVMKKTTTESDEEYQSRIAKAQEGMNEMQKSSFLTGLAGSAYEDYQSERDAKIAQRNALITKLDPDDEKFGKALQLILDGKYDELDVLWNPEKPTITPQGLADPNPANDPRPPTKTTFSSLAEYTNYKDNFNAWAKRNGQPLMT